MREGATPNYILIDKGGLGQEGKPHGIRRARKKTRKDPPFYKETLDGNRKKIERENPLAIGVAVIHYI